MINENHQLPLNHRKCLTCPFDRTDATANRLRNNIITKMLSGRGAQVCHGTEGVAREPRSLCRGARDEMLTIFYELGVINEATDAAWDEKRAELGTRLEIE